MSEFFRYAVEAETARNCLALVAAHCPELMRAGGGGLGRELRNAGRNLTAAERVRIVKLRREGCTHDLIALETGWSKPTVTKVLKQEGLTMPSGRRAWGSRRVAT